MLPVDLKPAQFASYPPEAKKLVAGHLAALQQLPLSFVPSLLREVIDYDYKFPAERNIIDGELAKLSSLSASEIEDWFHAFSQIQVSSKLEHFDWVNQPSQFLEQLSAHLWSTGQMDGFRKAAKDYGDRLQAAVPPPPLPVRRLGIAIVGQGVAAYDAPLFRNLRAHGTYFGRINPDNGVPLLLAAAAARAKAHPVPFGHWYVDGGAPEDHDPALTVVSYRALEPVRTALLKNVQAEVNKPGMGPEELRSYLARLTPADLGLNEARNAALDRFQVRIFTEGSGTQIFSTTFAQWTAREALRRAQPLTLLVRFAPRQQQKPMNELLAGGQTTAAAPDPAGSLVDAEMAAYYQWINQQRLPGSEQSAFLAWFEGHNQAVAIGPSLPRGTQSNSAMNMGELLGLVSG